MNRRTRSGWIAGLTIGAAGGFASLEVPPVGWLIVILFAIPAAIVGPRAAAIGGLLTGAGALWLVLLGRGALTCRAAGDEVGCQAPGIEPWLAAGGAMLVGGVALTALAISQPRRR